MRPNTTNENCGNMDAGKACKEGKKLPLSGPPLGKNENIGQSYPPKQTPGIRQRSDMQGREKHSPYQGHQDTKREDNRSQKNER